MLIRDDHTLTPGDDARADPNPARRSIRSPLAGQSAQPAFAPTTGARRRILIAAATAPLAAAAALGARHAAAQTSRRPFTLVVPYPPGGATDIFGRIYAEALGEELGEKIVVENRAGANGGVGLQHVANAAPDGRTVAYAYGNLSIAQELSMKQPPVRITEDLAPILRTIVTQGFIVAAANAPWKDLGEFIEAARRAPGRFTYADYGELTIGSLVSVAGIELMRVPYKGGMPGMMDVMAGQVDVIASSAAQALPSLRSGKLKALAISSDSGIAEFPGVRTVRDFLPSYKTLNYQGVFVPRSTPPAVIDALHQRSVAAMNRPEVRRQVAERHAAVSVLGPAEFRAFMKEDAASIAVVLKAAGITPQ